MNKKIKGFVVIKGDEINTGTFNKLRHVSKSRMVTLSKIDWPELEANGYSVRECEAVFTVKEQELIWYTRETPQTGEPDGTLICGKCAVSNDPSLVEVAHPDTAKKCSICDREVTS